MRYQLGHNTLFILLIATVTTSAQTIQTDPIIGIRRAAPAAIGITNARIVVTADETIEAGTLLVRDGTIVGIGHQLAVPDGFQSIDMSGRTIYPGFIDAFSESNIADNGARSTHWNRNIRPERGRCSGIFARRGTQFQVAQPGHHGSAHCPHRRASQRS